MRSTCRDRQHAGTSAAAFAQHALQSRDLTLYNCALQVASTAATGFCPMIVGSSPEGRTPTSWLTSKAAAACPAAGCRPGLALREHLDPKHRMQPPSACTTVARGCKALAGPMLDLLPAVLLALLAMPVAAVFRSSLRRRLSVSMTLSLLLAPPCCGCQLIQQ